MFSKMMNIIVCIVGVKVCYLSSVGRIKIIVLIMLVKNNIVIVVFVCVRMCENR